MTLGQVLREARQRNGWSLRHLERMTGISNGYLSLLETDSVKTPSPKHLHQLSEALGVSYSLLMELAGYVPPVRAQVEGIPGLESGGDLTDVEAAQVRAFVGFLRSARGQKDRS